MEYSISTSKQQKHTKQERERERESAKKETYQNMAYENGGLPSKTSIIVGALFSVSMMTFWLFSSSELRSITTTSNTNIRIISTSCETSVALNNGGRHDNGGNNVTNNTNQYNSPWNTPSNNTCTCENEAAKSTVVTKEEDREKKEATNSNANPNSSLPQTSQEHDNNDGTTGTNQNKEKKPEWLYIVGDSSMRMFNAALVGRLNGTSGLQDPNFGSYIVHDKGGCVGNEEHKGDVGMGCTREFIDWDNKRRITYTFKTVAAQKTAALDHLITESNKPTMYLLATGAHDLYRKNDIIESAEQTIEWIRDLQHGSGISKSTYSSHDTKFMFATLISCGRGSRNESVVYNDHVKKLLGIYNGDVKVVNNTTSSTTTNITTPGSNNTIIINNNKTYIVNNSTSKHHYVHVLDRQPSTIDIRIRRHCEGFHAYGDIVQAHVDEFLRRMLPDWL